MKPIKLLLILVRNTEKELLHLGASLGIKIIHLSVRQRLHHGCPGIGVGRLPPRGKWLNLRVFHDPVSIVNRWFSPGALTIISHDCGTHQVAAVDLELFRNQLPRGLLLSRQAPQVIENQPGFLGGEAPIPLTAADPQITDQCRNTILLERIRCLQCALLRGLQGILTHLLCG